MKSNNWFILFLISYLLILIAGCNADDFYDNRYMPKEPEKVTLSGKVTDQVTKLPVAGATIYIAGMNTLGNNSTDSLTSTDQSGSFSSTPIMLSFIKSHSLSIYTGKTGYAGSRVNQVMYQPGRGFSYQFELYHLSRLVLRIWNDTISNNIDEAYFNLQHNSVLSIYPGIWNYRIDCSGRKFSQTKEFNELWSNLFYSLEFYIWNSASRTFIPVEESSKLIMFKPDSTTYYSISF